MRFEMTREQARRFMLRLHGLAGGHIFEGERGVLDFIRQAGCVQFDPVDVCGKSAELALNSRVKGFTREMLDKLLYTDRKLVDYFDKNLSIFPVEDLPALLRKKPGGGYAEMYDRRGGDAVLQMIPVIRGLLAERGHISAAEVGVGETIEWHWGAMTSLPRAALESMYFRGELIVHHKTGGKKSYALTENHIPAEILNAAPPFDGEDARVEWHIKRRVGAVGLLQNRASDAFLGLGAKAAARTRAFAALLARGELIEIGVEGEVYHCLARDRELLERILGGETFEPRCELIAPLDSLIWDRRVISALFDFDYKWEIYTPAAERKYACYTLPVLHGERFIGRIEPVRRGKTLAVRGFWPEPGVKMTAARKKALDGALARLARLNGCDGFEWQTEINT